MVDDMVRFPCPKCGKRLKAPLDRMGRRASCMACGEQLFVPIVAGTKAPSGGFLAASAPGPSPAVGEGVAPRARPLPRTRPNKPRALHWGLILVLGGFGAFVALGLVLFVIILTDGQQTPAPADPGTVVVQSDLKKGHRPAAENEKGRPSSKEVMGTTKATTGEGNDLPLPKPEVPPQKEAAKEVKSPIPSQKTKEASSPGFMLPIEMVDEASGKVKKRNALDLLGSPEKMSKIAMISMDVTSKLAGASGKLAVTGRLAWAKGKVRSEIIVTKGNNFSITVNRDKGWINTNGKKIALSKESAEVRRQWVSLVCCASTLIPLEEWASESSALGDSEVRGRIVYGLQIASASGRQFKLFFDKKSGLLAKLEWRGPQLSPETGKLQNANVLCELFPLDYRETNGIKQPARIEEWHNGTLIWNHVVTKVQFSDQVDESLFAAP